MKKRRRFASSLYRKQTMLALMFVLSTVFATAQWSADPAVNTPICSGNLDRMDKQILSDGSGGLFVVWEEDGAGSMYYIYAQYFNNAGVAQWTSGGIQVSSGTDQTEAPQLVLDGSGGIIVAWKNADSSTIFAQKLNSSGALQWGANGINVLHSSGNIATLEPQLVSDGAGGAFITYDGPFGVTLLHVNSAGSTVLNSPITTFGATDTRLIGDGAGGVIIVWGQNNFLTTGDFGDLYAQRVNVGGTAQWTSGGVVVSNAPNFQNVHHIASDGSSGVIVAWEDSRSGSLQKAYAQRINSNGVRAWISGSDSNGIALCTAADVQDQVNVVPDGAGGAIFSWDDDRAGASDVYAQRVNPAGQIQWSAEGVGICVRTSPQSFSKICSDGAGGAIIVWHDNRVSGADQNIYAQRVNGSGAVQWTANGIAVSTAAHNQNQPLIVSNTGGGALVVWDDYRVTGSGNSNPDFYAQKITGSGGLTAIQRSDISEPVSFELFQNYPNPFNPTTTIGFTIPALSPNPSPNGRGEGVTLTLKVYDVLGREVATLVNEERKAGSHSIRFDASRLSSGVYIYTLKAGNYIASKKLLLMK